MSTSLMFVVLACCCFGIVSGADLSSTTKPILTIAYDGDKVVFTCTLPADITNLVPADDKVDFLRESGTASFKKNDVTGYTVATQNAKWEVAASAFVAAKYGSYTCILEVGSTSSGASTAVVVPLPVCSAAPRMVESLSVALICVLATVLKSHM